MDRNEKGRDTCAQESTISGSYPETKTIGWAIKQLWQDHKVSRHGWNGKGMHLKLQVPDGGSKMSLPYIYMKTADNNLVPWVASQSDLLATDWLVIRE